MKPAGSAHVAGIAAILATVERRPPMSSDVLLQTCGQYTLVGGSLPWEQAFHYARKLKLIQDSEHVLLTELGTGLLSMVNAHMQPEDEFLQLIALTFMARTPASRVSLASVGVHGGQLRDPFAKAYPTLDALRKNGLVREGKDGDWELIGSPLDPALVGLALSGRPSSERARQTGDLGEALTMLHLRKQGKTALQVSVLSDHFGFDILAIDETGTGIEAKATTGTHPRFHVSEHELHVAKALRTQYRIVVWALVRLDESVEDNYERLVALGYPIVLEDPHGIAEAAQPGILTGMQVAGGQVTAKGLTWTAALPDPPVTVAGDGES